MGLTRRKKIGLACVGILVLLFQLGSYLLFSSAGIPSIALRLTPDRTHFENGASFSWVLLRIDHCENLNEKQKASLLSLFRDRYSILYESEASLPENAQVRDSAGRWLGFNDGFSFEFSIVSRGPFWVRVSHTDTEGNEGGSFGEHVYVWVLGIWLKVCDGPQAVA